MSHFKGNVWREWSSFVAPGRPLYSFPIARTMSEEFVIGLVYWILARPFFWERPTRLSTDTMRCCSVTTPKIWDRELSCRHGFRWASFLPPGFDPRRSGIYKAGPGWLRCFLLSNMSSTSVEQLHRYAIVSELARGKLVLEIGLGEGYGSSLIVQAAKQVVGMDVTPGLVKYARAEHGNGKLFIVSGRYTEIPLATGRVDLVMSFGIVEYCNQGESMMAEIARVLRPGGIVIISSPYSNQSPERPTQQNSAPLNPDFV